MEKTITVDSDLYGEVVYEYVDTINTYKYNLGPRYRNFGSVYVKHRSTDKYDPVIHFYAPTKELNKDLPIAIYTLEEAKDKLKQLRE